MKTLLRKWTVWVVVMALLYSCASIGRIEGGDIDETPPVFVDGTPLPGQLNVTKQKVTIEFDEFIKLDKPNEKVVISPPQVQQPEVKANGKKVVVTLQDSLKANTTYTIDFGDAIQDNNEGNPLENFTYSFATGERLDSMAVAGTVLNAFNLEPVKGIQVGLHANLADSAFTTTPFYRVGRTDSRGHFSIRGIAPGRYRLYALQDADQNYYYSQATEVIAFNDSLVIPTMEQRVRQDTAWVDSLTVDTIVTVDYTYYLPDDLMLRCFKEIRHKQRLAKSERLVPNKFSLYFTAPADTFPTIKGLNFDETDAFVVEDRTGRRDTLDYWIRDSLLYQRDSLQVSLTYLHTDSLDRWVPRTDTLTLFPKLTYAKQLKQQQEAEEKERKEQEKRKKKKGETEQPKNKFLAMEVYAPNSMDVYDYVTFSFTEPVDSFDHRTIHLKHKVDSLWVDHPFEFERDSMDHKRFNLYAEWLPGESYQMQVDSAAVQGIYGLTTDKVNKEFKAKKLEEYGQIFFNVSGAGSTAFVELLDAQDNVLRTVKLSDGKADFYFLNPGKYAARLVNDTNGNGHWDTGDYAARRQPEEVFYYYQVLDLKANFDLTQDWNITDRPLDKQKPDELKKQKPDENKKKNKNKSGGTGNSSSGTYRNR